MNISCLVTNDFMEAVKNDETFTLHFEVEATGETVTKEIKAKELYHRICEMNWDYTYSLKMKNSISIFAILVQNIQVLHLIVVT